MAKLVQSNLKQKISQEKLYSKLKKLLLSKQSRDLLSAYTKLKRNRDKWHLLNRVISRAESDIAYSRLSKNF